MAKIPRFRSLRQAADFWDTHDFEDFVDDTRPVAITVKIALHNRILHVPLDLRTYKRIMAMADQRGTRIENMVSRWLKEKSRAAS